MSPTDRVITFRPDEDILDAMDAVRERDGAPYSEQIRRALRSWLEQKKVLAKRPPTLSGRAVAGAIKRRVGKPVDVSK